MEYLEYSDCHASVERAPIPGKKQLLVGIGCGVRHDLTGRCVSLVRDVVHFEKELRKANPVIVEGKGLVKIDVQDPVGRNSHGIAIVQKVAVVIIGLDPGSPIVLCIIIHDLHVEDIRRNVGDVIAVLFDIGGHPIHQIPVREIDVLGINVGVGTVELPTGYRSPIRRDLDTPIFGRVGIGGGRVRT